MNTGAPATEEPLRHHPGRSVRWLQWSYSVSGDLRLPPWLWSRERSGRRPGHRPICPSTARRSVAGRQVATAAPAALAPGEPAEIPFTDGSEICRFFPRTHPFFAVGSLEGMVAHIRSDFPNTLEALNASVTGPPTAGDEPGPGPTGPGASSEIWSLDLSRFVQTRDRMRILVWREL